MSLPTEALAWLIAVICFALWLSRLWRERWVAAKVQSEKKDMDQELAEQKSSEALILYFSHSLFRQNTTEDILWDICINCIDRLGFVDCVIYLADPERNVLVQKAAFGPKSDRNIRVVDPLEIPFSKGIVGSVYRNGQAELVSDVSLDKRYIVDDEARLSEITVPIITPEGQVLGVIDSEHPLRNFYTQTHLNVLSAIASICATKLVKAKADIEILEAKNQAEKANEAKSQFLATMSHEMRTPLNALIGLCTLMLENQPREDQIRELESMNFSAEQLLTLINNVLDISKIESGRFHFDEVEFDLASFCAGLHRNIQEEAGDKGIELRLEHPKDPLKVKADPTRLKQIIGNLVENALKFTDQGFISTTCRILGSTEEKVSLEFRVKDTGIGIAEEEQNRLFHQFEQLSNNDAQHHGGAGLGLAISKKLVLMQGGQIAFESKPGEGSEFCIFLELKKVEESKADATEDWKTGCLEGMKVLMVEDNMVNRVLAKQLLQRWKIEVTEAEDGKQGLEAMEGELSFDLVLMDLNMPVMNGFEAARAIRAKEGAYWQEIPIIALTANVTVEAQEEARESGMNEYISKPYKPERLFQVLKTFALSRSK